MLTTPIMVNSYETAITMLVIRDVAESLPDSSTTLVNEIRLKKLLLMPNAEVCRLTPPVLIPVLILRTLCTYSDTVLFIVNASEYTGALPVTTRLLFGV
jgi:hypothetical protein